MRAQAQHTIQSSQEAVVWNIVMVLITADIIHCQDMKMVSAECGIGFVNNIRLVKKWRNLWVNFVYFTVVSFSFGEWIFFHLFMENNFVNVNGYCGLIYIWKSLSYVYGFWQ